MLFRSANRIAELEEALDNALCLKDSIEEVSTLDLSKMMGERDHALCKLKEFMEESSSRKPTLFPRTRTS